MNIGLRNKEKGFTIIEVVLVLAIAGLIFLIVFLALPALQRSRRDTQRKNDAGRALAALESYSGNNNGNYDGAFANLNVNLRDAYLNAGVTGANTTFRDPSTGADYTLVDNAAVPTGLGIIHMRRNSVCTGTSSGTRNVAVRMLLEEGNYCQDNQ